MSTMRLTFPSDFYGVWYLWYLFVVDDCMCTGGKGAVRARLGRHSF